MGGLRKFRCEHSLACMAVAAHKRSGDDEDKT